MLEEINIREIYRNIKTRDLYQTLYVGKHSETLEYMVVYSAMKDGVVWVRPLELFKEKFEPIIYEVAGLDADDPMYLLKPPSELRQTIYSRKEDAERAFWARENGPSRTP